MPSKKRISNYHHAKWKPNIWHPVVTIIIWRTIFGVWSQKQLFITLVTLKLNIGFPSSEKINYHYRNMEAEHDMADSEKINYDHRNLESKYIVPIFRERALYQV